MRCGQPGAPTSIGEDVYGQPCRTLPTATMISSTAIISSPFLSPAMHDAISVLPRATFTSISTSSTVTSPEWLQSPRQAGRVVGVGVGVAVGVLVGDAVNPVGVGLRVTVLVGVTVAVGVFVGVRVADANGV